MNSEAWLEKAERLRGELTRLHAAEVDEIVEPSTDERETRERVTIARWLRSEFSDAPPEDTATMSLFEQA
jgi:hypothetical protein